MLAKKHIKHIETEVTKGLENLNFSNSVPKIIKNNYASRKQIIIFNIDPTNDIITNEILSSKAAKKLKALSRTVHFVFLVNSRFSIAEDFVITQLGFTNGYIVCNAGSYIYDIAKHKCIYESIFDDETKAFISHKAINEEALILASTQKQDLIYSKNYILRDSFGGYTFLPREYTDDFLTFHNFIQYNKFLSFVIFDNVRYRLKKIHNSYLIDSLAYGYSVSEICSNMFVISPKNASQFESIDRVLSYLNNPINDNVHYFALNFFSPQLWMKFSKHHYISVECLTDNIKNFKRAKDLVESQINSEDIIEIVESIAQLHSISYKLPKIIKK